MPLYNVREGRDISDGKITPNGVFYIWSVALPNAKYPGKVLDLQGTIAGRQLDDKGLPNYKVVGGEIQPVTEEDKASSKEMLSYNMLMRARAYVESDKLFIEASYMKDNSEEGWETKHQVWVDLVKSIKTAFPKVVVTHSLGA